MDETTTTYPRSYESEDFTADNPWTPYELLHATGHFAGRSHPAGTIVPGRRYPRDTRYVEIVTPDGYALTVDDRLDARPATCYADDAPATGTVFRPSENEGRGAERAACDRHRMDRYSEAVPPHKIRIRDESPRRDVEDEPDEEELEDEGPELPDVRILPIAMLPGQAHVLTPSYGYNYGRVCENLETGEWSIVHDGRRIRGFASQAEAVAALLERDPGPPANAHPAALPCSNPNHGTLVAAGILCTSSECDAARAGLWILKRSEQTDRYVLAKRSRDGSLGIYLDAHDVDGCEDEPFLLLQDDGIDLVADFETHVDALLEEHRVLMADALREFGRSS